jgi:hypothetical protein
MMEEEEAIRGSSVSVAERGGRMGMASATTTGMPGRRHLTNICIELGMSCSSSSVELQMGPQVQIKKKKKASWLHTPHAYAYAPNICPHPGNHALACRCSWMENDVH